MAARVWRFEVEKTVEQRLERLEVHVEHIQSDVTEVKAKLGEMDQRLMAIEQRLTAQNKELEQRLTAQNKELDQKLTAKIDKLIEGVADLNGRRAFDRVWFMLMSAALLGIMAKAFKWI
jgi:DNA anti-recombination protein RmuC